MHPDIHQKQFNCIFVLRCKDMFLIQKVNFFFIIFLGSEYPQPQLF